MRNKRLLVSFLMIAALFLAASPVMADMIEGMITKGLKYYKEGKYEPAMKELEFAVAQLRQKKADSLSSALPAAPAGWKARKASSQSAGAALMGGGISAQRRYDKEGGQGNVEIQVMTDSPMLQAMAMALSNPMMLQSSGAKLVEVQGERAMIKANGEKNAQLTLLLDHRILVQVSTRRLDDPEGVAKMFADKIDLAKLKTFGK